MGLTAAERETVIVLCDAEDRVRVTSSQAKWVTRLLRLEDVEILSDKVFDGTRIVDATVPIKAISDFRGSKSKGRGTADNRGTEKNVKRCTGHKNDGSKCNMIAVKGTDFCRWHQKG